MTIKHHIILSATITLALIAIIACQSKTQAPETKKQNKSVSKVATVVEKSTKEAENIATEEIEKAIDESSTKIEENVQDVKEEVKEAVDATEAEVEKKEAKVNEVESNVEYSVKEEKPEAINLFVNGAFNDGLKGWNYDKNVAVIEEDGQKTIELTGSASEQTRIWQRVSTISGHVYRLSFKLKADQSGALAILRDNAKEEESYFFTGESKDWKVFKKDFKSIKNGEYLLFLSCKAEGKFYYSRASFIDVTKE